VNDLTADSYNSHKANRLTLIIVWLALILAGLPNLILNHFAVVYHVVIVWGLGFVVLLPATIIYFRNKNSNWIRYIVSCGMILIVYALLYVQKGMIDNLFWILACLVASSIFFDRYVSMASTAIAVITGVLLYLADKSLFFPALRLSEFIVSCIVLVATGIFLIIQGDYGKKLIANERNQLAGTIEVFDKFKDVMANIGKTSEILDQNINGIKNEALNVKNETTQITSSIQEFSAAVEQTANLASESNSALTAINELIQQTAGQSENVLTSSSLAYDVANEGKTVISDLVNQIRIVGESVKAAGEIVAMLSVESKKINDIAAFINDITRKTNLLALNASIEASRAGAVGEGFMVVAGEMKSFAEQTAGALSGITQILRDLSEKIDQVGNRITDGETAIRIGMEKTNLTQECFVNIISKTSNIKTDIERFMGDIQTLSNQSTVVFANLADITKFTEESVATMQELTSCSISQSEHVNNIEERLAVDLVELSEQLKTLLLNRE
jgi:methyl-accepting chemotaxis protein